MAATAWPKSGLAQARAFNIPIGFQTFAVRNILAKDFSGTLKTMAQQGYQLVEMCSPQGYTDIGFGELTNTLDEHIGFAHQLGLSQMICSTFWLPKALRLTTLLI